MGVHVNSKISVFLVEKVDMQHCVVVLLFLYLSKLDRHTFILHGCIAVDYSALYTSTLLVTTSFFFICPICTVQWPHSMYLLIPSETELVLFRPMSVVTSSMSAIHVILL